MRTKTSLFRLVQATVVFGLCTLARGDAAAMSGAARGTVVTRTLESTILRENRTGLETRRAINVYLPPGYANSERRFPVVYFCHNIGWSGPRVFADGNLQALLERGFAAELSKEFIVVAADYSTTGLGSLYENSPVSGRWLDFTVRELVPFIDANFRTLAQRDSRAVVGDFMGGRGALALVMRHADVYGAAYALHPVATGAGMLPYRYLGLDWDRIHAAKRATDLAGPGRDQIFATISQAFLPNLARPPLYCDFFAERENGELRFDPDTTRRLQKAFHLDEALDECAANLRSLRGLALDWARHDSTPAHVESNRDFSRKLLDLSIEHEAEEYVGNPWDKNWTPNGRFYGRVLPFLGRTLVFAPER